MTMRSKPRTVRKPGTAKVVAATRAPEPDELRESLKEKVIRLHDLRQQGKQLDLDITKTQEEVLGILDELGDKSVIVKTPNGPLKAIRVQNVSTRLDEAALKHRVGAALWKKITTLVLDRKKLEAFVASGEIDPITVAECSMDVESKPFIRVS